MYVYATVQKIIVADSVVLYSLYRFKVDMSPFPLISKINDELEKLEAFQKASPFKQPDCPEDLKGNSQNNY